MHARTLSRATALALVLAAAAITTAAAAPTFDAWARQFGKTYSTRAAEARARAAYATNVGHIAALTAHAQASGASALDADATTRFGVNQYSDLTPDEFKETVLMPSVPAPSDPPVVNDARSIASASAAAPAGPLPPSLRWSEKGAVTPVKDQGTVGSCWSFSTTGNIEGQHFLKTGKLVSLSEEALVDCDNTDCGVFGGWPLHAYQWIIGNGGLPTEAAYPYCSGTGDCYPCMADTNKTFCGPGPTYCNKTQNAKCGTVGKQAAATISSFKQIPVNETEILHSLFEVGPLSVLVDADWLQYYSGGIWQPAAGMFGCDDTGQDLDHAVLLTGFGSTSNGTDYWYVKNSWGKTWGEDGYVRWLRNSPSRLPGGVCGINTAVTTSIV